MQRRYIIILGLVALLVLLGMGSWYFLFMSKGGKTSFNNIPNSDPETSIVAEPVGDPLPAEEVPPVTAQPEEKAAEAPVVEEHKSAPAEEKTKEETESDQKDGKMPAVTKRLMSSGFASSSGRKIDTIILHSSYDALGDELYSVSGLVKEYEEYGVSAHYLIDRQGKIYQLVADKDVSYHAGVSKVLDGRTGVNDFSIGIEIMNTEEDDYTKAQYAAVQALVDGLKSRYAIKYVLGHDDIAPGRKSDPWNFDWKKL